MHQRTVLPSRLHNEYRRSSRSRKAPSSTQKETMVFLRFFLSLALVLKLSSGTGPSVACERINNWHDLIWAINDAQRNNAIDELRLCPFRVTKPADKTLVLNRALIIRCIKTNVNDKCQIVGSGIHAQLQGPGARITVDGFTFIGATHCAIRVYPTAVQPQNLINCEFLL